MEAVSQSQYFHEWHLQTYGQGEPLKDKDFVVVTIEDHGPRILIEDVWGNPSQVCKGPVPVVWGVAIERDPRRWSGLV